MVCFRSQLIGEMGLATTGLHAALSHQPVALQREKMRAHRVVSEPQLFSQIINCRRGPAQQTDYTAARAFKKPFIQSGRPHTHSSTANIHLANIKHNKSRTHLTYSLEAVSSRIRGHGHEMMLVAGVIEIIAGVGVAFKPKVFAYVVSAWLLLIVINLLMIPGYFYIALRDFGLAVGALALARLSHHFDR